MQSSKGLGKIQSLKSPMKVVKNVEITNDLYKFQKESGNK